MSEENKVMTLREALSAGFDRVEEEENSPQLTVQDAAADTNAALMPEGNMAARNVPEQTRDASNQAGMLSQAMQVIEALRSENARLSDQINRQNNAMAQQSRAAEVAMEDSVLAPQIPQLNFRDLQYMSDEEQEEAVSQWQQAIADSAIAKIRGEFAPLKQDYEDKRRIAADAAAKSSIFRDSRFSDFEANSADIERIAGSDDFKNMSPEHRYLYSGLIARALKHDPSSRPSTDDIIQMAMANPDVIRAIETRRAQDIQKKNDSLPVLSASSGFGNANPLPENTVKNKEELESRVKQRFGL